MLNITYDHLRQLKLSGMVNALQNQTEHPAAYEGLSFVERLNLLLDNECLDREHRKQHTPCLQRMQRAPRANLGPQE